MEKLGEAVVVLIPKVKIPVRVAKFRPISLCNMAYKVVAKMLANWLKVVLDRVISLNQSAFVPGRLITDNVITGFESLHSLRNMRSGKKGFMALKVDTKGLFALISGAEAAGGISGIAMGRGAPSVSHLLFTDDSLMFVKASLSECRCLRDILRRNLDLSYIASTAATLAATIQALLVELIFLKLIKLFPFCSLQTLFSSNRNLRINCVFNFDGEKKMEASYLYEESKYKPKDLESAMVFATGGFFGYQGLR
ncbi:hypothetical protein Dsin_016109 [Dipteronia sinensis]|uniref:Reverse transcriptase domain-containing protein n=1 Tax=Dipteronia sinensis TaxID=43782 RepID=A0AAE0E6M2_9ROSI|nr:hypothetical protein Dsin_016109 [Dipteronia sinensis]